MDVSFFAEMAWKSALIAGAALMLAYVLRSRAAADRALVLRIGVAMLLLLPLIAMLLPALPIALWAAPEAPAAAMPLSYAPGPEVTLPDLTSAGPRPAPTIWDDPTPLVLLAYLGGLAMVGGRLLAGLILLRRWTRDARAVTCPHWLAAFERVRGQSARGERLRLLVSDTVPSPLSWGHARPVILIDPDTLDEPDEADAILAHEVAHVARGDWLALMLARVSSVLFWFNPLVWLLEREIVQQAEEAADREAAAHVEPALYAQTLLSWAQVGGRAVPANSIAPKGSALGRRVRAILDRRMRERPAGSGLTRIAVLACIVIAAPVAAMKLVQATAPEAPPPPAAPIAPGTPVAPPAPHAPHAPLALGQPAPVAEIPDMPDMPDVAQIVASATAAVAAIDPEEIQREVDEAMRESRHEIDRAQRVRIEAQVRRSVARAQAEAARARVQAMRASRPQIELAMREAQRAMAEVAPRVRTAMASGAEGMARGAEGMEQGARHMEEQAARLRDPAYRERQIARARARGETVTHEELIEAADGMREGAQGMREGAREMREQAERMRRGHTD